MKPKITIGELRTTLRTLQGIQAILDMPTAPKHADVRKAIDITTGLIQEIMAEEERRNN